MLGQVSTAKMVSDRDGSGLTGDLCRHGETVRAGIAVLSATQQHGGGLRRLQTGGAHRGLYEDHVTQSSAAQSGGLLL